MLEEDPEKRITPNKALRHAFLVSKPIEMKLNRRNRSEREPSKRFSIKIRDFLASRVLLPHDSGLQNNYSSQMTPSNTELQSSFVRNASPANQSRNPSVVSNRGVHIKLPSINLINKIKINSIAKDKYLKIGMIATRGSSKDSSNCGWFGNPKHSIVSTYGTINNKNPSSTNKSYF